MGCGSSKAATADSSTVGVGTSVKNPAQDTAQPAASGSGGASKLASALEAAQAGGDLDLSAASGVSLEDLSALQGADVSAVRKLSIKGQKFAAFPPELLVFSALTELDASENLLTELPAELGSVFPLLERLDVSENSLTSLPDSLCGCSSLSVLIAFKNELKALPEDIGSLTHLQEANFFNNSLIRLPASISKCTAMLDFNVADNRLKTLPDLSQWTAVTRIAAFANTMVMLPSLAGPAATLEQLQLHQNPLTELPDLGSAAPALTMLDMNSCQLAEVPDARLAPLTAVTTLNLKGNKLTALPEGIGAMAALEILNVGANQLSTLPAGLASCTRLKTVLANGNAMATVPPVLLQIPTIYRVMLKGNPVMAGGDDEALDSLRGITKGNGGWVR